ncbi:uncharacterized protein LOC141879335 isoform X2 [Acropora palmata]|uniref:uncharacterized protein LOC141879335 isoform X2 n=1 Tax=Acropora palmata TaxID=6131 RepID=UPI003D9FD5C8
MESSIIIVTTLAALLLFSEAVAGNRCSRDQYKKGDDCLSCASCPPGQEITLNCGHDNKGVTTDEKCKSCSLGSTFSDRNSTDRCTNCLRCETLYGDKIEIKKCTLTSNTVCGCRNGTYESEGGNCVAQKITPKPTIQPKKTTITVTSRRTKTTLPITSKVSTTKPSSPLNNTKKNELHLTTPWRSSRNPLKATDKSSGTFRKPGWIVLFCLMAVCLALFAVAGIHSQTRKKIGRCCCGAYGELSTDADTTSVLVEGHHEESVIVEPINNATPIPPTEESMLLSLRSHSTTELCYSNGTDEALDEQMKCTCAMKASETSLRSLDKLAFTSLSAETIVNGGQDRLSSSSCSALRSENNGVLSHSCSNCRAPSPLCGRSTDHNCMTSLAPSTCVTRSLPYTPENSRVTSPANSCCPTGLPSSEHSPEHRYVTPSSWSTRMSHDSSSSSGVSPDPSNVSSFQSHSNFGEDHEVYSQSGEYTPSSQMQSIPISVEAVDHAGPSKAMAKNSHLTPKKATKAKSVKERENLSTKGDVTSHRDCEPQLTESSARKESRNDKEKKMTQKPADEDLSDSVAMSSNGNATRIRAEKIKTAVPQTNKYVTPRSHCKYRPIQRHEEHRCSECCPQPEDSFFQLINKERLCLKEQICKELSRSYKDLAISARVENKTAEWETSSNPAELVLDTIKASHPKMKLKEFDELLLQMKRLDIVELIQNHHLSCSLCQRNRFDSRA